VTVILFFQIAGAGHGLGRELAIQFSMLGATVICWDIQADINEETAVKADSLGFGIGKAYAYTCDISNRDQVQSNRICANYGSICCS